MVFVFLNHKFQMKESIQLPSKLEKKVKMLNVWGLELWVIPYLNMEITQLETLAFINMTLGTPCEMVMFSMTKVENLEAKVVHLEM